MKPSNEESMYIISNNKALRNSLHFPEYIKIQFNINKILGHIHNFFLSKSESMAIFMKALIQDLKKEFFIQILFDSYILKVLILSLILIYIDLNLKNKAQLWSVN